MTDIDYNALNTGDIVWLRLHSEEMVAAGVDPLDFPPTIVYFDDSHDPQAGGFDLRWPLPGLKIIKHSPKEATATTDIDISKVQPGDTVRVKFQTRLMQQGGVEPIETTTTAYKNISGIVCAAGLSLGNPVLRVLEHTPSDWRNALTVRGAIGNLWGRVGERWYLLGNHRPIIGVTADVTADHLYAKNGPIAVETREDLK